MSARGLARGGRILAAVAAIAALTLAATACTAGDAEPGTGLHLSGQVDGRTVSVSQPYPALLEGDCEARAGLPSRVCVAATATGGTPLTLGLANLDRLEPGAATEVVGSGCSRAESCARIEEGAVVLVVLDGEVTRPRGGTLTLHQATAGERYVGDLTLELPGGRLTGAFDVRPRPEPERPVEPGGDGSGEDGPGGGEAFTPDEVEPADPEALDG